MKVKPYAIGGTANSSVGTSSNPWAMVAANNSVLNSTDSMEDVANAQSPTILTRFRAARSAAAAAAAAQQTSNSSHSVNKSFGGATTRPTNASSSSTSTLGVVVNGHKSQHHIGKIVKPIPVRPMSSSASSTHSSSYHHHHHHHHHHSHHQNQQQLVNFISNSLNSTGVPTANPDANEFSLIAKYFASFPATRLKTSTNNVESDSPSTSSLLHNHQSNQGSSNASISPILNQNTSNSKRTPFLPFKKSSISTASTTNMPPNVSNHHHHQQDLARVSGLVATPSSLVPIDLSKTTTSEHHPYNLRNHAQQQQQQHQNTDHLCSNFRRMIKLNESHILAHNEDSNNNLNPSSPYTAASNTPTGCLLDSNNDSNDSFTHNFNQTAGSVGFLQTGLNNDSLIMPPPSITDRLVASTSADRQASSSSRFAQITMETRLTRKFLIKHHPYLQYHGGYNGSANVNDNKQSTQQPPRPSINLIKMKKLANKRLARQQETRMNNGSCANDSNNDDSFFSNSEPTTQKLLKFTDMAPSPGLAANNSIISSLRSTKQRSIKQQASKTSIRTRRNSSMIETDWANESADKTVDCMNSPDVNSTLTSTPFITSVYNNGNSSNNNPSLTNCGASSIVNSNNEFDDSKEDSSGYYSSYHSTDLISSSGGSVVGVGDHGVLLAGKHMDQPASTNSKTTTTATNQNTGSNSSANTSTNQTSHHHYHTRYSNAAAQLHTKKMSSTPPTTRLRYHQQQLATNNDLDLDQIEND